MTPRPAISRAAALVVIALVPLVAVGPAAAARPVPLRALAAEHGITIGSAANLAALTTDRRYRTQLGQQLGSLTPENEMKWDTIHPARDTYDFTQADRLVAYARRNGMQVRGHTLVWQNQNPGWLTNGTFTRDEWIAILVDHITTVVGHYRGQIAQWDVVNEAMDAAGNLRDTIWLRHIGPEYIELAFRAARAADPDAELYYNDFGAGGVGAKADAVYDMVSSLVDRGVPIDGVGTQAHWSAVACSPCGPNMAGNMARLDAIGLDAAITEIDVRIALPVSPEELDVQADLYAMFLRVCMDAPNCDTFTMWGFTDRYSWVPQAFPGFGAALIYDEAYAPKPAETAIRQTLEA